MFRVVILGAAVLLVAMPAHAQAPGAADSKARCFAEVTAANAAQAKAACSATLALPGLSATERWDALYQRVIAQARLGENEAVARDLAESIRAAPSNLARAISYMSRGTRALTQGSIAQGESDVAQAMSLSSQYRRPGVPDAVTGGYYVCMDPTVGTAIIVSNCSRVLAASPLGAEPRTVALVTRARALASSGDLSAAEKDLATALTISPTPALSALAYESRGQARLKGGRKAEGDADLAMAAALRKSAPTPAPAPAPIAILQSRPQPGGLTDRQLQARFPKREDGEVVCYFRQIPGLTTKPDAAVFVVEPTGRDGTTFNSFQLVLWLQRPPRISFSISKPSFAVQRFRGATLWVDGRRVVTELVVAQYPKATGRSYGDITYENNITVNLPQQHLASLEAGRTAELAVYDDATREAGRWSYDVSRLRYVGRAIELSRGQCS